jgi:ribonuclease P protein component
MAGIFTLGKEERLKSRKAIEELFSQGQRLNQGPFRAIYKRTVTAEIRLGVGVSNRLFKKSVDRNRIKRLMREVYRVNKLPLKEALLQQNGGLHLFITYAGTTIPDHAATEAAVKTILKKLLQRVNENNTSNT